MFKEAVQSFFNRAPLIFRFPVIFFLNTVCESTVLVREKARRSVLCSGDFTVLFFIHSVGFSWLKLKITLKMQTYSCSSSSLTESFVITRTKFCNYTILLSSILVAKDHWEKNHLKLNWIDYNLLPLHTVWSSLECILALVIYIIARIDNTTVLVFLMSFGFNKANVERSETHEALTCLFASWSKRFFILPELNKKPKY